MRLGSRGHVARRGRRACDPGAVLLPDDLGHALLDLRAVFGNNRPVELEIGIGKGTFLLARAAARPELNFLGLEWARPYCAYAADRARRAGLPNVRVLCTDAGEFFQTGLQADCLWRLHIYFPDPWPKHRHHARRLIQPRFLVAVRRALRLGGQLAIVTDHLDYFAHIRRVLTESPGFAATSFPQMADRSGELVGTNFERKYIAQGRRFYHLAVMRYR